MQLETDHVAGTDPRQAWEVLIVGAGPVGLAAAVELGSRGIRCLVVERNDRVGHAPRAKTTNVRTRTHLRRWGIAGQLAEASPFGVDFPTDVQFVTRLSGHRLALMSDAFNGSPARDDRYPEHAQWIPQYRLEEVLRAHAATLRTVEIRFETELTAVDEDEAGVTASLRDLRSGETRHVRSTFLIGADGARSRVREAIGATLEGDYGLSRNYNVVFRAPGLSAAHKHGPAIMYWHVNPDAPALIGPMDRDDVWFFMPTKLADGVTLGNAEAARLIARTTGIELPYEILSTDQWVASRLLADRYQTGRIFLAGDACHLHPPFGGHGMNMGVGDAVDLGWKIAAVLRGWGGPKLLEAYTPERRPVHEQVLDEAVSNHAVLGNQLWTDGLEDGTPEGAALRAAAGERIMAAKAREFYALGTVIGYRYEGSPVIVADGAVPPPRTADYVPSARPGHVAPHGWLDESCSLYDLFGPGFALVATPRARAQDVVDAATQAAVMGIPFSVVRLEQGGVAELYEQPLTLVRPDQHVAWRGPAWSAAVLPFVTGKA